MNAIDRNKLFIPKKFDLLDERESFKTKIRKEKLEDRILSRRVKFNFLKNKYEIKVENLELPKSVIMDYEEKNDKTDFLIKLLHSDDINIVKFALVKLRLYTLEDRTFEIESWTEEYLKFKIVIEIMLNLLRNRTDNGIQFEASFVLLNITANTDFYNTLIIQNSENLTLLIDCLIKFEEEEIIYENFIWVFANFFLKEDLATYILKNTTFYQNVYDRFVNKSIFLIDLKITFTRLFGNIYRSDIILPEVNIQYKEGL